MFKNHIRRSVFVCVSVALLAGCLSFLLNSPSAFASEETDLLLQINQLQALIQNLESKLNAQATAQVSATVASPPPSPPSPTGIWVSKAKVATLPTSGAPWTYLKSQADATCPTLNLADLTNYTDQCAAAKALVFARLGTASYRATVEALIQQVASYTNSTFLSQGGRCLELGRNVGQYAIAADLIDLKNHNSALDAAFRKKLVEMLNWTTNQNGTLMQCSTAQPTNWGTQALHSRVAIDLYVGNSVAGYSGVNDLATAANIFRGYLGDWNAYHGFDWAHLENGSWGFAATSWYQDRREGKTVASATKPTPIAALGTTIVCQPGWDNWGSNHLNLCKPGTAFDLSGRVFDLYRGGHFKLLPVALGAEGCIDNEGASMAGLYNGPCYTDYAVTAMQGYIATAEMLYQAGYDSYDWSNQAIRRSVEFSKRMADTYNTSWWSQFQHGGWAAWIGYLVNARYGLALPVSGTARATGNGTMGWTDWTTTGDIPYRKSRLAFESLRWPHGVECLRWKSKKIFELSDYAKFECGECGNY